MSKINDVYDFLKEKIFYPATVDESVSFCSSLFAFSGFSQSSEISPRLIVAFSSRLLRWRGTSTKVASIRQPL
jgi:hypothetical protein